MEDKEDTTPKTSPGFQQGKSGWMKKAHGRILLSYKDRYVTVDRTEILVYENEDQKNCLERVDLENYDKCHELKTGFKKKHRLVLLRSPKAQNKVHDMKFQAPSAEEKEAWIKALCDGISRAKNKIFDELKVDESSNLEHVTRSRPKGNRGRRPPTRIHMKEVADVSSDGILRLDLDLENATMPNGTQPSSSAVDGAEKHKESTPSPSSSERTEDKALTTIKEAEDQDQSQSEEESKKKTVKPPASPSKEVEKSETKTQETSPDPKKKIPPMPPNKPLLSIITPQEPSPAKTPAHPPTPPSKTKKPTASTETNQEATQNGEKNENEKDSSPTLEKSPKLSPKQEDRPKSGVQNANVDAEESKVETPTVVVSLNDSQSVNLSPLLGHTQGDNGKKAEEKSVDSGQHSDDNSEDSACEYVQMRDSNSGLDELDGRSSSIAISINLKPQNSSNKGYMSWISKPPSPLKPQEKIRSFSSGNLLFDSCDDIGKVDRFENREVDMKKLENEVAMEMEDTNELLNRATRAQTLPKGDKNPENLLAEAMEKLKKADHVLREVKKLKLAKDDRHRKSW